MLTAVVFAAGVVIGACLMLVLGHLDGDKAVRAIAEAVTRAEKAERERAEVVQFWDAYQDALRNGSVSIVFSGWVREMEWRSARLAAHEEALKLIAKGCSRPAKVAAAALETERARSEDEEAMAWVQ